MVVQAMPTARVNCRLTPVPDDVAFADMVTVFAVNDVTVVLAGIPVPEIPMPTVKPVVVMLEMALLPDVRVPVVDKSTVLLAVEYSTWYCRLVAAVRLSVAAAH